MFNSDFTFDFVYYVRTFKKKKKDRQNDRNL